MKPEGGKVGQHAAQSEREQARHVFHENSVGMKATEHAREFGPQPPRIARAAPGAGEANGLAGEPAHNDIWPGCAGGINFPHVCETRHAGPVPSEHRPAKRIGVTLPSDGSTDRF
jgi:hypothetical protein